MDDKRARFEAQVMPHVDAAYRLARWLCQRQGEPDDLLQEAILRAFRGFEGLRGSDVKAWLLTIVRNCHFTALKQIQRRAQVPLPEEEDGRDLQAMTSSAPGPEKLAMQVDQAGLLDRLLATMPEEQRTVLLLREIEELDYAQIAAVTNVPIGTVMSRLSRSRAALKSKWLEATAGDARAMR